MTSNEFWDQFETRIRQAAPGNVALLPKGADAKAIVAAGALMGVTLPAEVKEFSQRHNGSGRFCIEPWPNGGGPQYFMSLKNIVSTWKLMCKIGADFEKTEPDYGFGVQEGPMKRNYWNRRWIPFAEKQCGDNIYLDLDPAEGGNVGQIVDWWHERGLSKLIAPDFLPWLDDISRAIKTGKMQIVQE